MFAQNNLLSPKTGSILVSGVVKTLRRNVSSMPCSWQCLDSDHKYLRIRDLCQELAFVTQCGKTQSCNSYNSFVFTVL